MAVLDDFDRFKRAFAGFIRTVMNRVDYFALYPCTVASQNADGSLELAPDLKAKLGPGLSAVKYKPGIPGATVTVAAGTRVLLGFENGDPSRPYAGAWDQIGTVTQLNLNATNIVLNGGAAAVGRVGDAVTLSCTAGPYPVVGTATIAAGAPGVKA